MVFALSLKYLLSNVCCVLSLYFFTFLFLFLYLSCSLTPFFFVHVFPYYSKTKKIRQTHTHVECMPETNKQKPSKEWVEKTPLKKYLYLKIHILKSNLNWILPHTHPKQGPEVSKKYFRMTV